MISTVTSATESADLEQLGEEIAELAAHLHAATYQLLVRLREFDQRDGWSGGFRSCAHWLSWRTGIDLGAAREKVRVARALRHLPRLGEAMKRGQLSYAKLRAVTRIAEPTVPARTGTNERSQSRCDSKSPGDSVITGHALFNASLGKLQA